MGKDVQANSAGAGKRRRKGAAFYQVMMESVIEIGEIARIETEIQKLFPPASPQLRCPDWDILSLRHLPGSSHSAIEASEHPLTVEHDRSGAPHVPRRPPGPSPRSH